MRLKDLQVRSTILGIIVAVLAVTVALPGTVDAGKKDRGYIGIYMQDLL